MKNFFLFIGGCFLFLIVLENLTGGSDSSNNKYPQTYYYTTPGWGTTSFILNADNTAKVVTKMENSEDSYAYQTSWESYSGKIVIKGNGGVGRDVIRDGYLYSGYDDADAKRDGKKLTLQE